MRSTYPCVGFCAASPIVRSDPVGYSSLSIGVRRSLRGVSAMYSVKGSKCSECSLSVDCSVGRLPEDAHTELDDEKRTLVYEKGESIFHMGDDANYFYSVRSGSVQVFRNSPHREQSFSIVREGGWLGHRDALYGSTYCHGARVLKKATVCKFPRRLLLEWMDSHPTFTISVARELAGAWAESENQSYNLGARRIMERLADFLLNLRQEELTADGEEAAELPMTREVMATLMGTSTESVIRALSDFRARGWIDTRKGKIVFTNKSELARLVAES